MRLGVALGGQVCGEEVAVFKLRFSSLQSLCQSVRYTESSNSPERKIDPSYSSGK